MQLLQSCLPHPALWKVLDESMLMLLPHRVLYRAAGSSKPQTPSSLFNPPFSKEIQTNGMSRGYHRGQRRCRMGNGAMCSLYVPIFKTDYASLQYQEINRALDSVSIKATAVAAH